MPILEQNDSSLFVIENPEIQELAEKLAGLTPDFNKATDDTSISLKILKTLNNARLSAYETKQVVGFVRYHWGTAVRLVDHSNPLSANPDDQSVTAQLSGFDPQKLEITA